jgi:GT2 family glycosyltransferase
MVDISVIIVNYNVKYFLEQALLSVQRATQHLQVEILVVDNNSTDGSVELLKSKFKDVHLIDNQSNTGFAVANNQAYALAKGKYILLLNPDTIVAEDTLTVCYDFMEKHHDCGALAVRMIDGTGTFLPESKRGFPSPFVAFCKTFGLSTLFPTSKIFNRYYLGHLGEWQTCEIDVLAGAYMFMQKSALEKVGMLDEAFFMYGEDIDLSYRIVKGGFKNYYLPTTTIVHYKGESTKKGSLNYVKTFYQAMIIFAKKHFVGSDGKLFVAMLQMAIYLRAFLTLFSNFLKNWSLPLIDATLLFGGLYFLKDYWAVSRFGDANYYKPSLLTFNVPLYILGWLTTTYLSGGYDRNATISKVIKGIVLGTIVLMAIYGLLPMLYRSSRMLLLLGAFWAMLSMVGLRFFLHFLKYKNIHFFGKKNNNVAIVGSETSSQKIRQLMFEAQVQKNFIGVIAPHNAVKSKNDIGAIEDLATLQKMYGINEIIFCADDISNKNIIAIISSFANQIAFKIVPPTTSLIIGSSSKDSNGELYLADNQYNINLVANKRGKRLFDVSSSILLLLGSPLLILFAKNRWRFFPNILYVLLGKNTWIGYATAKNNLPTLKKGIFTNSSHFYTDADTAARLDYFYAKDYTIEQDILCLWKNIFYHKR